MQEEVDLVAMEHGNLLAGIPMDIVGAVVTVLTKNTTVLRATQKRRGTKIQQQGPTPCEVVRPTRIMCSGEKEEEQGQMDITSKRMPQ
eukprot:13631777-Ditylum_brightwellii.AAC.1